MRIILSGSRHIRDERVVQDALMAAFTSWNLPHAYLRQGSSGPVERWIHGAADGFDRAAHSYLQRLGWMPGIDVMAWPAWWDGMGRDAGPARNRHMLEIRDVTHLVAAPAPDSRGTRHMIQEARAMGLTIHVHEWS